MGARWREDGSSRRMQEPLGRAELSRRAALAGGTVALAAALAGCAAEPTAEPVLVATRPPATGLRDLLDGAPALVVSDARLDVALLKRFYARHDFKPVWATRRAQADPLIATLMRAGDHGLDTEQFHAAQLRNEAALSPLERDVVLSDAFLSYADALARGAVPVERRKADEVLAPEPIDVAAVLDDAIASDDPGRVIEGLAPTTPTYGALREALQRYRSATPARNAAAIRRLRTIEVNLERQRWLPRSLPASRAWINVADERLVLYRADQPVFTTRVVVGEDIERNQSPEFRATIDASFYNPPWVIPADIAKAEILTKLGGDPDYLTRNKMVLLASGEVEQLPGPDAGLGLIMFDMPNRFDVYLHDTPTGMSSSIARTAASAMGASGCRTLGTLPPCSWISRSTRSTRGSRRVIRRATTCRPRFRCSWCTRPRSSMPATRCSTGPTSTTATPRSGGCCRPVPRAWLSGRRRTGARPRPGPCRGPTRLPRLAAGRRGWEMGRSGQERSMVDISQAQAQAVVAGALAEARGRGLKPMVVVVLDARGAYKALLAEDGTSLRRAEIAHGKAHGALAMGMGSRAIAARAEQQPTFVAAVTHVFGGALVPVAGGVLVRDAAGALLGAVGASGDTSDNDEAAALAGIAAAGLVGETG